MEKKRKIIPPVHLLISLVLMWLMQNYLPLIQLINPPFAYGGIIAVFCGIAISAISAGMFKKADTGIRPFDEATALVTSGFYRYTRNPMYLGMFLVLFGMAFLQGSLGALLPLPLFVLIIRNHFVLGEERFMEAAFGQSYLDYKSTVRRWI